ncbi:uncharacterized protein LOC143878434 [Tasmannia lanceolata]|uniref:uncharacterized protein LOC143878434 n=1 Tax=Tasmannia lanceolata TaxID=3420 RepID=UPI00406455C8
MEGLRDTSLKKGENRSATLKKRNMDMEENRKCAEMAKEKAEIKFANEDFKGAKRMARRAQILFPRLEGIAGMLAGYKVHLAGAKKMNNQKDYYKILGVSVSDDFGKINKKYKKLAMLVNPYKNQSKAAVGAFKLIGEAKDFLLDAQRRKEYDLMRKQARNEISETTFDEANGCFAEEIAETTVCKRCGGFYVREGNGVYAKGQCPNCNVLVFVRY